MWSTDVSTNCWRAVNAPLTVDSVIFIGAVKCLFKSCHITFSPHVYELTFTSGGGGDGWVKSEIIRYFKETSGQFSAVFVATENRYFWWEVPVMSVQWKTYIFDRRLGQNQVFSRKPCYISSHVFGDQSRYFFLPKIWSFPDPNLDVFVP